MELVPDRVDGWRVFPAGPVEHEQELARFLELVVREPARRVQIAALYRLNGWSAPPGPSPGPSTDGSARPWSAAELADLAEPIVVDGTLRGVWLRTAEEAADWRERLLVTSAAGPPEWFAVHLQGRHGAAFVGKRTVDPVVLSDYLKARSPKVLPTVRGYFGAGVRDVAGRDVVCVAVA